MSSYFVRDSLLDPVECTLYKALSLVVCQRALLFAKIRLDDLLATTALDTKADKPDQLVNRRVDFVLCDRDTLRPLAIILLEEKGAHTGYDTEAEQIAQLCTYAGVPLVWLPRQNNYLMQHLSSVIEPLLAGGSVGNDFSNGDRLLVHAMRGGAKSHRKQPSYPGYGALKTIAGKLS